MVSSVEKLWVKCRKLKGEKMCRKINQDGVCRGVKGKIKGERTLEKVNGNTKAILVSSGEKRNVKVLLGSKEEKMLPRKTKEGYCRRLKKEHNHRKKNKTK